MDSCVRRSFRLGNLLHPAIPSENWVLPSVLLSHVVPFSLPMCVSWLRDRVIARFTFGVVAMRLLRFILDFLIFSRVCRALRSLLSIFLLLSLLLPDDVRVELE